MSARPASPVAAVVLAAGASRRMGRPKPLLPLGGSTYLDTVLRTLARAEVEPRVVVLGSRAGRVRRGSDLSAALLVHHRGWRDGMLGSLQAGIRLLEPGAAVAALLAPVDTPRFAASTIRAVVGAFRRSGAPIVLPTYRGRHGHPALFARTTWAAILEAPPSAGARAVVDAHRRSLVEAHVEDPWILRDADTPEEHARMQADADEGPR